MDVSLLRALGALAAAAVAVNVPACGGDTGGTGTTNQPATLPACTWPSSLDGDPTSRETCHANREYLSCDAGGGATALCTSSDGSHRCEQATPGTCKDQCKPNEYVAACGGVGPGPIPDPPAGCRSMGAVPAGIVFYCCPCD